MSRAERKNGCQMALGMIKDVYESGLPFGQAAGDSVYGADSRIQKHLEKKDKKYLIFRRDISEKPEIQGYIAYGDSRTKLEEFVRTAGTRWTIETNFADVKGETGLDHKSQ